MQALKLLCIIAGLWLVLPACNNKGGDDQFNRAEMLTNMGNNIILPAHQQFNDASTVLKQKKDAFISSPSSVSLDSLKASVLQAYATYMKVEAYSFIPSENIRNLNSFPTDTVQIGSNITSGFYDLNTANNIKAKGFPALDFMLFGQSENEVISLFTSDIHAANRKQYLSDLVNEIQTIASNSVTGWNNYRDQFINASGTDIGGSTGMLVNDLSFQIERCRRERVGNALGYIGILNSGTTNPGLVEAYYSSYSNELLIENLKECKKLYTGATGTGFDDYLNYMNASDNGQSMDSTITNQFDAAISIAENIPVNFATAVNTHKSEMESLFLELKKLTVLIKVDMSSRLGVIITYSDNDGD